MQLEPFCTSPSIPSPLLLSEVTCARRPLLHAGISVATSWLELCPESWAPSPASPMCASREQFTGSSIRKVSKVMRIWGLKLQFVSRTTVSQWLTIPSLPISLILVIYWMNCVIWYLNWSDFQLWTESTFHAQYWSTYYATTSSHHSRRMYTRLRVHPASPWPPDPWTITKLDLVPTRRWTM